MKEDGALGRGVPWQAALRAARFGAVNAAPLALGLGVVVAGGAVAALVATRRAHEADALDRIEKTLARLEGRLGASGSGGEVGAQLPTGSGRDPAEPWYRRPGAVLDWLPPDGVALAKEWFRLELVARATKLEGHEPLDATKVPEWMATIRQDAVASGWKDAFSMAQRNLIPDSHTLEEAVATIRLELERLDDVRSEVDLARWLHESVESVPERWQLAEFAATRAGR